jgi:amino acid permease
MANITEKKELKASSWWSFNSGEDKEAQMAKPVAQDDIFDIAEGDIEWKNLSWWQCGIIMVAETISLGILSLPATLAVVGLVPGIILIISLGVLATYSGYLIGQFRLQHPAVNSMGDAFEILGKRYGDKWAAFGRELGGIGQLLFMVFLMSSHILTWTICLDHLTDHATCNIVWGVVGMVLFWVFDLPRTLKNMSYMSMASSVSVLSAVMVTMVALAVEKPAMTGPNTYSLWPAATPPFYAAFISVSNIVFAYAGHAAFFSFISELKDPKHFTKSLAFLQCIDISLYSIFAVVTYVYAGQTVKSPTLSSTSSLIQKIAYGIAIPTIVIAGVIYGHVNAKYIYVRIFKGTEHMAKRTTLANGSWISITASMWILAWIIAQSIPNFGHLLGLMAALFGSWFTYGAPALFWLHVNGFHFSLKEKKKTLLTILNVFLILISAAVFAIGVYSSSYAISITPSTERWSCATNL